MSGATLQHYSTAQTAKMVGVSRACLRAWARSGLFAPSVLVEGKRHYSFQDLVALRCAKSMLERGVSLASIRKGLESLKEDAPGELAANCLARHRALAVYGSFGVRANGRTRQAATGQLCLDFSQQPSQTPATSEVLPLARLPQTSRIQADEVPLEPQDTCCAQSWYSFGVDCESLWSGESPTDIYFRRAQRAYLRTVELQADHAPAWTNLGTLHATLGDASMARHYYEKALECDPTLPEPGCNLAELDMRDGAFESARTRFAQVLARDEAHLEAMYGLARAHIALGEHEQAVSVLEPYCARLSELDEQELDQELQARLDGARLVIATHRQASGQGPKRSGSKPGLSLVPLPSRSPPSA